MKCAHCATQVLAPRRRFCSKPCLIQHYNRSRPKVFHSKRRCKACGKWYRPKHTTAQYCGKQCSQRTGRRVSRSQLKRRAIEYKGGKCQRCGYKKCVAALEFHHRKSHTKQETIGGGFLWAWKRLKRELDKCDLFCANCHREVHMNQLNC